MAFDGVERLLQALSGGERVAFYVALAHALGAGIRQGSIFPDGAAGRIERRFAAVETIHPGYPCRLRPTVRLPNDRPHN